MRKQTPVIPDRVETLGIIGGGQLALMLAQAASKLNIRCIALDPDPGCCASAACEIMVGSFDDSEALGRLADRSCVMTYEFENIPTSGVCEIASCVPVMPSVHALETAQDRRLERTMFDRLGIATPKWAIIEDAADIDAAIEKVGAPSILKSCTMGYDGKGQARLGSGADPKTQAAQAWDRIGRVPAILDEMIPFTRELSLVACRAHDGATVSYPLAENIHKDGILRITRAPAKDVPDSVRARAAADAAKVLDELGYIGVLAVEFFQIGIGDDAKLLANEIAPRVHNTGHWTIEGAATSQFENHVRAVCALELGSTQPKSQSAMVNIIGSIPSGDDLASLEESHIHLYGKSPRPGRKLGHINITAQDHAKIERVIAQCEALGI